MEVSTATTYGPTMRFPAAVLFTALLAAFAAAPPANADSPAQSAAIRVELASASLAAAGAPKCYYIGTRRFCTGD